MIVLIIIALCNNLIDYCKRLQPEKAKVEVATEETKFTDEDTFKNESGKVLISKRDRGATDDYWAPTKQTGRGRKKKRKRRKKFVPEDKQGNQALQHQIDILQFFTDVHVGVPHFENQLENTIKQLEEKVDYYVNLPPPEDEEKPKKKRRKDDDDAEKADSDVDEVRINCSEVWNSNLS